MPSAGHSTGLNTTASWQSTSLSSLSKWQPPIPNGPIFLALDNVITHDAKVVRAWLKANPRVRILWLPKYAAHDANPVERIRGLMKGKVAANRLSGNINELTNTARRFFTELAPHPVQLLQAA